MKPTSALPTRFVLAVGLLAASFAVPGRVSAGDMILPVLRPTIDVQPTPQRVCAGGTATFSIGASGGGTLRYQWFRANGAIVAANDAKFQIANAGSWDVLEYRCEVSNEAGTTVSDTVVLGVDERPIGWAGLPVSQILGRDVQLTGIGSGCSSCRYAWSITPVDGGSAVFVGPTDTPTPWIRGASAGDFRCRLVVFSEAGCASDPSDVTITYVAPIAPALTAISLASGADRWSSASTSVAIKLGGTATEMLVSEDPRFRKTEWRPFAATFPWTFTGEPGTRTLYVKLRNAWGESAVASDTVDVQPAVSILDFQLAHGAAKTDSTTVSLDAELTSEPVEYQVSEEPTFSGLPWLAFVRPAAYTLYPGAGTKTVYFRVRRGADESFAVSDQIRLSR